MESRPESPLAMEDGSGEGHSSGCPDARWGQGGDFLGKVAVFHHFIFHHVPKISVRLANVPKMI